MCRTAVLFIIFNRPDTTMKVFEAIRQARPSKLYIAADAPRTSHPSDKQKCAQARAITEHVDWPCEVRRLYQQVNLGCSLGPRAAFDWFFSQEPEGIILEDDCLPHPDFFSFATFMLKHYRDEKRIISINGSNLGYNMDNGFSYTYSRFMNMWGWATWSDRAAAIDYTLASWKQVKCPLWWLYRHMRQNIFDADIHWYRYWQEKFDRTVMDDNITWWDWQWIYHQLRNKQLSIVPGRNLVANIGFGENATHTKSSDNPAANIHTVPLSSPFRHPSTLKYDKTYEEHYIKWVWCYHKRMPFSFYIKHFLASWFKPNCT